MINWNAIGALANLFGAIGVIVSLIYLARQLKLNRQIDQVSAFQGVFNGYTHHSNQFYAAPNKLAFKGLSNRSQLTVAERMYFDQLLSNMLNQLEMTVWLMEVGLMSESEFAPVVWMLENKIFCYPGAREWLDEWEPCYPPEFVKIMRKACDNCEISSQGK